MRFFKRKRANKLEKKMDKAHNEDNIIIAVGKITILIELTENADHKATLSKMLEDVKFISPISVSAATKAESKIIAKLDDLKISMNSARREARVIEELSELRMLITERNVISN